MVYTTIHIEAINRVTVMANLGAEAMVMTEVITMDTVTVGLIIMAITAINTVITDNFHHLLMKFHI